MDYIYPVALTVSSIVSLISLFLSLYIFIFFKKLSKGVGKEDLIKILKNVLEIEKGNSDDISNIRKAIEMIEKKSTYHIQKMSLVRFNPFSEMGGDHSFSLALLDAHNTGILLTGLHTRERTRVYIKKVDAGKCRQDLSKEEKEALAKALS